MFVSVQSNQNQAEIAVSEGQWVHVSQVWHEYGCFEMRLMKQYSSDLHNQSMRGGGGHGPKSSRC